MQFRPTPEYQPCAAAAARELGSHPTTDKPQKRSQVAGSAAFAGASGCKLPPPAAYPGPAACFLPVAATVGTDKTFTAKADRCRSMSPRDAGATGGSTKVPQAPHSAPPEMAPPSIGPYQFAFGMPGAPTC